MLVLEYMEGGDLYQAIQENSYPMDTGLLSWYQKGSTIALDIAKGLAFLHQHEVSPCSEGLWLFVGSQIDGSLLFVSFSGSFAMVAGLLHPHHHLSFCMPVMNSSMVPGRLGIIIWYALACLRSC